MFIGLYICSCWGRSITSWYGSLAAPSRTALSSVMSSVAAMNAAT